MGGLFSGEDAFLGLQEAACFSLALWLELGKARAS
jgi:hypothetical protein